MALGLSVALGFTCFRVTGSSEPPPAEPPSGVLRIGFFGDSITAGYGLTAGVNDPVTVFTATAQAAYPDMTFRVYNLGVNGQSLLDMSRLSGGGGGVTAAVTNCISLGLQYVSLNWGHNGGVTAPHYNDVISAFTAAGLTVYVNQILWSTAGDYTPYNTIIAGLSYNSTLRQGDTSAFAWFQANQSALFDGTHPNSTGAAKLGQLWATALMPSIAAELPPVNEAVDPLASINFLWRFDGGSTTANGYYTDVAGTVAAVANDPVACIRNWRGDNAVVATQSTLAKRPTLKVGANGRYYLKFDNATAQTLNLPGTYTGHVTYSLGMRSPTSNWSYFGSAFEQVSASTTRWGAVFVSGGNTIGYGAYPASNRKDGFDKALGASFAPLTTWFALTIQTLSAAGNKSLGMFQLESSFFCSAEFSSGYIFDGTPTAAERALVENYIKDHTPT